MVPAILLSQVGPEELIWNWNNFSFDKPHLPWRDPIAGLRSMDCLDNGFLHPKYHFIPQLELKSQSWTGRALSWWVGLRYLGNPSRHGIVKIRLQTEAHLPSLASISTVVLIVRRGQCFLPALSLRGSAPKPTLHVYRCRRGLIPSSPVQAPFSISSEELLLEALFLVVT